jgi:hypothetical protein
MIGVAVRTEPYPGRHLDLGSRTSDLFGVNRLGLACVGCSRSSGVRGVRSCPVLSGAIVGHLHRQPGLGASKVGEPLWETNHQGADFVRAPFGLDSLPRAWMVVTAEGGRRTM